jgi:hypothetical protein
MAPMTLAAATAAAMKILGKDAKIPPVTSTMKTAHDQDDKAYDAFDKSRKELEAKLLTFQNAVSAHKNAIKQYADQLDASDFGLDDSDKEVAKNIEQAQKILGAWADAQLGNGDFNLKNLDELDKHLMNIAKYNHRDCGCS